ncbi:MAG: HD domain-containing protein [Deltaproteobacteria bacterium]|nr:MAG: HD domain-containing protein [Deltaproteobacteria bacterium]
MERTFIDQIRENDQVDGIFWVKEKAMSTSRAGTPYVRLRLSDRTGEMEGRIWDGVEELFPLFEQGDFIKIKAHATSYQERLQLSVKSLRRCGEEEVSLEDFLPSSDRDPDEMLAELIDIGQTIENRYLGELVMSFLRDEQFTTRFKRAPGAKRLHHVYLGGLLEHTLSMVKLIQKIKGHYAGINYDLLLAGGIVHDVGKVHELSYDISFDYTDEGRLLGHILLGVEMVERKISGIEGFPSELAMLVKHLILSHHGQYDWGSPKRPKTLEAQILHHLDDLDAKINGIQEFMKKGEEGARWTDYHRMFDRFFYLGDGEER